MFWLMASAVLWASAAEQAQLALAMAEEAACSRGGGGHMPSPCGSSTLGREWAGRGSAWQRVAEQGVAQRGTMWHSVAQRGRGDCLSAGWQRGIFAGWADD